MLAGRRQRCFDDGKERTPLNRAEYNLSADGIGCVWYLEMRAEQQAGS
jgi:hypothetical protein